MATRIESSRNLISQEAIQFIRALILRITLKLARPNTTLYVYFDGLPASAYCNLPGNELGTALYSDAIGQAVIELHIPPNTFNTGSREIIVTDASDLAYLNTTGSVYGKAVGSFSATGTLDLFQTTYTTIETITREETVTSYDPLAQSFFTTDVTGGMFLTSIELFFQTKDPSLPVWIELRQMINGYPDKLGSNSPNLISVVEPASVNISNDSSVSTKFTFPSPVYLDENSDYCFVVRSNSKNYNIYTSKMGEVSLETGQTIFEQPYVGSLFKSENNITWQPEQFEDIKFIINKAVFDISGDANINFFLNPPYTNSSGLFFSTVSGSNIVTYSHPQDHGLEVGSRIKLKVAETGTYNGITGANMNGTFTVVSVPNSNTVTFQVTGNANKTGVMESGSTVTEIQIDSGGINYSSDTAFSFVSPTGSGAVATPTIVNGTITKITITDGGTGYVGAPSIVITATTGSGAVLVPIVEPAFAVSVNKPMTAFVPNIRSRSFPNTSIKGTISTVIGNYDGGNLVTYSSGKVFPFEPNPNSFYYDLGQNSLVVSRQNEIGSMASATGTDVNLILSSNNPNLSPVVDLNVMPEIVVYSKKVNAQSGETLTSTNPTGTVESISVVDGGTGYTLVPTVTIIGTGTGATAHAVLTSNYVSSVVVDTAGTGFTSVPIVVITRAVGDSTGVNAAAQAVLTPFNTEILATGGNAKSRYITRRTTLQTISTGIRLISKISSGSESSVDWYIRTSLSGSNAVHESLTWTRLNCLTERNKSTSLNEPYEYEFTYDGLPSFDTYDLKCVLLASDPTKSPQIHSFRSIILA